MLPPVFGGQKGIAAFNYHLAGHMPLVCLCSENNEPSGHIPYKMIASLPLSKAQFFNPFTWKKIKAIAIAEQPGYILLEHPYHAIAARRATKATHAKLILHSHNIESERFRQYGKWWWPLLRSYEKRIHRKADLILFKTEKEREFAITNFRIDSNKCMIVPFGVEKKSKPDHERALQLIRETHSINNNERIFVFAGTLDYLPNAKAVENIYRKIAPRLDASGIPYRIIVCGRNRFPSFQYLKRLSHPSVIQAGEVTDIGKYFAAADCFINTVESGGGIQTKNLDALANHCPVVCFENMVDSDTIVTAPGMISIIAPGDWDKFVQECIISHPPSETPNAFFEKYSWEKIAAGVAKRIRSL